MTWREERRRLNNWLDKKSPASAAAKHITGQKKRTLIKRRKVEANRKWRKRHPKAYRALLREAKVARARRNQDSPPPRKARKRAQVFAIVSFFLCPK